MEDKTLEYIRKHITKWPEGAKEVCLEGSVILFDNDCLVYHPKDVFIGDASNIKYTHEEWEQPTGHVLDGGAVEFYHDVSFQAL
jgi:hypothetical protein